MKTALLKSKAGESKDVPTFTFPGLFRSLATGSIWMASSEDYAIRIHAGNDNCRVGDVIEDVSLPSKIIPTAFEQVRETTLIEFQP